MADDDKKAITSKVVDWAAGQPFNNVLLLAIFAFMAYGTYFAMNTAIPKHLEQIQQGYQSLVESHKEERQRTLETYDKWMNSKIGAHSRDSPPVVAQP